MLSTRRPHSLLAFTCTATTGLSQHATAQAACAHSRPATAAKRPGRQPQACLWMAIMRRQLSAASPQGFQQHARFICQPPSVCVQAVASVAPPKVSLTLQPSSPCVLTCTRVVQVMQTTPCAKPQQMCDQANTICTPAPDHSRYAARQAAAGGATRSTSLAAARLLAAGGARGKPCIMQGCSLSRPLCTPSVPPRAPGTAALSGCPG